MTDLPFYVFAYFYVIAFFYAFYVSNDTESMKEIIYQTRIFLVIWLLSYIVTQHPSMNKSNPSNRHIAVEIVAIWHTCDLTAFCVN